MAKDGTGLYEDVYEAKHDADLAEYRGSKATRVAGEFKRANFHDNGTAVDEFGIIKHPTRRASKADRGPKKLAGIDEEASTRS